MTKYSFNNDSTPAERRRRVLRETGTYRDVALGEAGTVQGRYYGAISKTHVTGAGPEYPPMPETSPWHRDPVPDEPPLNQDVNVVEPVGTFGEIEHSLRESSDGTGMDSSEPPFDSSGEELRSADALQAVSDAAPSLPQSRRRNSRRR